MFNEDIKLRFIKENIGSVSSIKTFKCLFERSEPYEKLWEKDICEADISQVQEMIDSMCSTRARNIGILISTLRRYYKWYSANINSTKNDLNDIHIPDAENLKKIYISGPVHLQYFLDKIYDSESENTMSCVFRSFYWLAFSGIKDEDIMLVKKNDVSLEDMIIHYKDIDYPIYQESIQAIKRCVYSKSFVYFHPNYSEPIVRDRIDSDVLLSGIKSDARLQTISVFTRKKNKEALEEGKVSIELNYSRIRMSGIFYRMYERERAGFPVDFSGIVSEYISGKEYKLDKTRLTNNSKIKQIANDYITDYERWKLAYTT